ncbi:MAG TPA: hypothetical protein VGE07_28475, partial [Herpetosiphonaceae bacterium]
PREALRRQLVAFLMLLPALCPLILLSIVAPAGPVRWALMAVTLLAGLGLGLLLLRAYRRMEALALAERREADQAPDEAAGI